MDTYSSCKDWLPSTSFLSTPSRLELPLSFEPISLTPRSGTDSGLDLEPRREGSPLPPPPRLPPPELLPRWPLTRTLAIHASGSTCAVLFVPAPPLLIVPPVESPFAATDNEVGLLLVAVSADPCANGSSDAWLEALLKVGFGYNRGCTGCVARTSARMPLFPIGAESAGCSFFTPLLSGGWRNVSFDSISVRVSFERPRIICGRWPAF